MIRYILAFFFFHLFYHVSYFLTFDVISYHLKKKTPLSDSIECYIHIFYVIFTSILFPYFSIVFFRPFGFSVFPFFLTFCLGIAFTKDVWNFYRKCMISYSDFSYYKYYQMDPCYLRKYFSRCRLLSMEDIDFHRYQEIQKFLSLYPYSLEIRESRQINAYSDLEENKILITTACFQLPIKEIKAMLGHEIMHFEVDGKISNRKRKRYFFLKLYGILLLFSVSFFLISFFPVILQLLVLFFFSIFCCLFFFFHVVMAERYLYQLSELKCDRLACQLEDVSKEGMLALLQRIEKMKVSKRKEKWYLRIIRRYFLFADHPNIRYRIKKIKKYRNWSIVDYVMLPAHLIKQLLLGKGWNDD